MSLNYTTLQTAVLAVAKRTSMTTEVVECIRRCEGMIRRELLGYELQASLAEVDRSALGVYTAPSYIHYIQSIFGTDTDSQEYSLNRVGLANIKRLTSTSNPLEYAHYGDSIEFRGIPGTDAAYTVHYIGHPAPLTTTATNTLLTDHEDIYISGSLFQLYFGYLEDFETAQLHLDLFGRAIDTLNNKIRRKMGGGVQSAGYNLGNSRNQRGY